MAVACLTAFTEAAMPLTAGAEVADTQETEMAPAEASGQDSVTSNQQETAGISENQEPEEPDNPEISGWVTETVNGKKQIRYYEKGKYLTGLRKIKKKFYYFNKNGIKQTGTVKDGKWVYYLNDSGVLIVRKKGDHYFYSNGKKMSYGDEQDFITQLRAKKIVAKITTKKMSEKQKLKKCFKWVLKHPYIRRRKFNSRISYWPAQNANDIFVSGGGDCHADGAAMAYLAAALGYKKVYVCRDTASKQVQGHCWAEINNRVYDPVFAEDRGFSRFYAVPYSKYYGRAMDHVKIPRFKYAQVSKEEPAPVVKTKTVTGWDSQKKHMYYSDGSLVKGIVVYRKKFFAFDENGDYQEKLTVSIRKAAKQGHLISELTEYIGQPKKKTYTDSCYGDGKDGIWKYANFRISTYKDTQGNETFMSLL